MDKQRNVEKHYNLEAMNLEELEVLSASFPQHVQDKADRILKAFAYKMGEAIENASKKMMQEDTAN